MRSKNFKVGHFTQAVQPNMFIPAMLTGAVVCCITLLVTLNLAGGHKVSAKANPLGFIFSHTFVLFCFVLILLKRFRLNILILRLSES